MARGLVKKFRERREKRRGAVKAERAEAEQLMQQNQDIGQDFMSRDYVDPVGQAAQTQALDRYSQLATTGFTDADRMAQQQANAQAAQYEQSQRQGIVQDAQMRGMGGSGMEVAAQLQAQQSGADRAQQMQSQVAQDAQQRSLSATDAMAGLGGGLVGQGMQAGSMQQQGGQMLTGANAQSAGYHLDRSEALAQKPWDKVQQIGQMIGGLANAGGSLYSAFSKDSASGGGGGAGGSSARTAAPAGRTAAPSTRVASGVPSPMMAANPTGLSGPLASRRARTRARGLVPTNPFGGGTRG